MPLLIGIAGGTGSGKSTLTREITSRIGKDKVAILPLDSYYRCNDNLSMEERNRINYDHPASLEMELYVQHLQALRKGETIERPIYDFSVHNRRKETVTVPSREIIIVEGILIFTKKEIRDLLDIKIFVDAPADIRLLRRINRDMLERKRKLESIESQYLESVRPMHLEFVEPSKQYADIIVPGGGYNKIATDMIVSQLFKILAQEWKEGQNEIQRRL